MATRPTTDVAPYLTGPAYGVALLFVVMPIVDTLAQVWPVALGTSGWRYGAVGLGANYLISVLFGMFLLCVVADLRLHRRTLRVLGVVNGVATLVVLIAVTGFVLDALQVRLSVPRDNARTMWVFDVGVAKAVLKYLSGVLVFGWLAYGSWRAGSAIPRPAGEDGVPKLVHQQQDKTKRKGEE